MASLSEDMCSLLAAAQDSKSLNCGDVALAAKTEDGAQHPAIWAHVSILTSRCKFFLSMFRSGLRESRTKEAHMHVRCPSHLAALVEIIYTDALAIPQSWTTVDIIDAVGLCKMVEAPGISFVILAQKLGEMCWLPLEEHPRYSKGSAVTRSAPGNETSSLTPSREARRRT